MKTHIQKVFIVLKNAFKQWYLKAMVRYKIS